MDPHGFFLQPAMALHNFFLSTNLNVFKQKSGRLLAVADLVLTSMLGLIALTSRKGFGIISLEAEDKLKPSKEQSASLFSLGTFSWVDDLVW